VLVAILGVTDMVRDATKLDTGGTDEHAENKHGRRYLHANRWRRLHALPELRNF
jgi:hypothetical protein